MQNSAYPFITVLLRPDLGLHCLLRVFMSHCCKLIRDFMFVYNYIGLALRKCVFGHMRAEKAHIGLRIRAVWSVPSLSAYRIIAHSRIWHSKFSDQNLYFHWLIWVFAVYYCHKARKRYCHTEARIRDPRITVPALYRLSYRTATVTFFPS